MRTKTAEKPLCDADAKCDSTLIYLQQIKRSEEKYIYRKKKKPVTTTTKCVTISYPSMCFIKCCFL